MEGLGDQMVRPCLDSQVQNGALLPFPSFKTPGPVSPFDTFESAYTALLAPFANSSESDSLTAEAVGGQNASNLYIGGETRALARLAHYTDPSNSSAPLATYKQTRNGLLGTNYSSKFSPWLACGALSPRMIWEAVDKWDAENTQGAKGTKDS